MANQRKIRSASTFVPGKVFSIEEGAEKNVPRVFISPQRYIQGANVLDHLGRYLSIVPCRNPVIFITKGGEKRHGRQLIQSLESAGIKPEFINFDKECSLVEIERLAQELIAGEFSIDCLIVVGGGKCLDAGKCVAYRLDVPLVICPTIASNDAPVSAVSVMYTQDGVFSHPEFFPNGPVLVVVDTRIIADAPVRYLIAGIGDAMATWFEARTCARNLDARSHLGARLTQTALALSELASNILFEHGEAAVEAARKGKVSEDLEREVEANTYVEWCWL